MDLKERELFGSCIKILAPLEFKDVSDIRQVPDNQEVFVSPDSDATLIVELLDSPSEVDYFDAGIKYNLHIRLMIHFFLFYSFHWSEICQETGSTNSTIEKCDKIDISEYKNVSYIIGTQNIPKFGKQDDSTSVKIRLLCLRIQSISTDILISTSSPKDFECFTDESFIEICKSFKILNWSLFK